MTARLHPLPELLRTSDRRRLELALFATARSGHELLSCLTKVAYFSERRAEIAAMRARKRTGEEIVAYRCVDFCGCWHIGHRRES